MTDQAMDRAISELMRKMYRMPEGVSRKRFRQGMRRILILQVAGTGFLFFFEWFAAQMRAFQ